MRSADIPKIGNLSEDLIVALLARLFSSLNGIATCTKTCHSACT